MAIPRVPAAAARPCAAGAPGGTGQAGPVGEVFRSHDVAVAWVERQRLAPPAGWTTVLVNTDLLHRASSVSGRLVPDTSSYALVPWPGF
jgi:hypothetical protein